MNIYINRYKVYNICGTDIADLLLISKLNKGFCFLLSGIYMYIYIYIYIYMYLLFVLLLFNIECSITLKKERYISK